jgi:hypothetical protein
MIQVRDLMLDNYKTLEEAFEAALKFQEENKAAEAEAAAAGGDGGDGGDGDGGDGNLSLLILNEMGLT